jgi:RimJ/RimL family protein N-acetyltransferase
MMFAVTERLLLRPGWLEDAEALHAAIAHESVAKKLAKLPWPYTLDDARAFLSLPRKADDAEFLIFTRTMGAPRLIGGIGLMRDGEETEIGYWLSPRFWGLGFATEAGRAVVDIARHTLKLPRLVSGHFVDNPASGHVLRKLGFRRTGQVVPRLSVARGAEVPCALYEQDLAAESGNSDDGPMVRTRMAA